MRRHGQACNVTGKVGTCSPVSGAPRGSRAACASGAADPACASTCDGTDVAKCNYPTSTTSCGSATCSAGAETHVGTCNGAGACASVPKGCAPYVCDAKACFASCTVDTNCAAGNYCKGGLCVPNEALGKPCTGPTACGTLACTDGFCCGTAACGTGATCAFPGKEGTCVKVNGGGCTAGAECGSGECVDAVCCDTACNGQCEACDVPDSTTGRPGKCIPVKGKPHGTRTACADGGGDTCAAATCDGNTTTGCAAFTGSAVTCRPASCTAGVLTAQALCDGKGKCPELITASCDGFVCAADGTACEASCVDDTKCVATYRCKGGKCVPKTATCSDDGLTSTNAAGTVLACAPYRCAADGTCSTSCGTSDDCSPGNACDVLQKNCIPSGSGGEAASSGGCAVGASREATFAWSALATLVALVGRTRRTRRTRRRRR